MRSTFPRLKFNLLVGIGGGVPIRTDAGPIRLGHVVVSKPTGQHSGAVQYDRGKAEAGEFQRTGSLAPPPNVLLNAAQRLAVFRAAARDDPLQKHLQRLDTSIRGLRRFRHPGSDKDHLYQPDYIHADRSLSCQECGCAAGQRVIRRVEHDDDGDAADKVDGEDDGHWVIVHRGTVASGDLVMRNGKQRDVLAKQHEVHCFDMEAAGASNDFPCLVIRGISDYSDSHKNDRWQGYAASVAAAYARELFTFIPLSKAEPVAFTQLHVEPGDYEGVFRGAARDGLVGTVRKLLDQGTKDLDTTRDILDSSLYDASGRGHVKVVELLLENGARVKAHAGERASSLQAASQAGHTAVVQVLLRNCAKVDARRGALFDVALQGASVRGHTDIVRMLLEHGADANTPGPVGHTLQMASAFGYAEIVELLLEHGADIDAKGGIYNTALQAACRSGHTLIARRLLEYGADVNARGGLYDNGLGDASATGNVEIVKLLLDCGARADDGALNTASYRGHIEVVKLLLDAGAGGISDALRMAKHAGHTEVIRLLTSRAG